MREAEHFARETLQIAEYALPVDAGFVMSERYRTTGSGVLTIFNSRGYQAW
jgi:hypothetical protein